MNKLYEGGILMEYMIHTLIQILLVLGLANLCLLFVPKTIRKTILGTFKFAFKVTRFVAIQLKIVVKYLHANYKEIEQPKKRKTTHHKKSTNSKVIQFPKSNVK
jgi:hypothetical protein